MKVSSVRVHLHPSINRKSPTRGFTTTCAENSLSFRYGKYFNGMAEKSGKSSHSQLYSKLDVLGSKYISVALWDLFFITRKLACVFKGKFEADII